MTLQACVRVCLLLVELGKMNLRSNDKIEIKFHFMHVNNAVDFLAHMRANSVFLSASLMFILKYQIIK